MNILRCLVAAGLFLGSSAQGDLAPLLRFERVRGVDLPDSELIAEGDIDADFVRLVVVRPSTNGEQKFWISAPRFSNDTEPLGPFIMLNGESRSVVNLPILGNQPYGGIRADGDSFRSFNLTGENGARLDRGVVVLWDNRASPTLDYGYLTQARAQRIWTFPHSGLNDFITAAELDPSWAERLTDYSFWAKQADGTVAAWDANGYGRMVFRPDGTEQTGSQDTNRFPESTKLQGDGKLELLWVGGDRSDRLTIRNTNGAVVWSAALRSPEWVVVRNDQTLDIGVSLQHYGITQFPEVNGERLPGASARLLLKPPHFTTAVRQRRRHRVVRESEGLINVEVRKLGGYDQGETTINYKTRDGTAKAGSDYVTTQGRLYFEGGETTKHITIPIIRDSIAEPAESFFLDFDPPTLSATPHHEITIQDDMRIEWLKPDLLRIWQPSYRNVLRIAGDATRLNLQAEKSVEFLTSAADYIDLSLEQLNPQPSSRFFLVGSGDDDDIFNVRLP